MSNIRQVEICKSEDGNQWYINAIGGNGEIVLTSEMYVSKANARRSAEEAFPGAMIVEEDEGAVEGHPVIDDGV